MARVLLLGPDRRRALDLRTLMVRDGHDVTWLHAIPGWYDRERELEPDVVVAAVGQLDGVIGEAGRRTSGFAPPLLVVQQEADLSGRTHLENRLVDRLASPFMGEELLARLDALVRVRRIVEDGPGAVLKAKSNGVRNRLSSWFRERLPDRERPVVPYMEVAARVAEWADRRDAFEPGHAERVTSFSAMIAEGLAMGSEETTGLLRAAMLHDIGKAGLPMKMLHQPTPLEESQQRLMRTHPARGAAMLRALDPDESVARVVLCHHERPDGRGYYGKPAEAVPRAAFALAVAETYDAMTSSRLGRTLGAAAAMEELECRKGTAFDSDSVDALVDTLRPRTRAIPLSIVSSEARR